MASRQPQTPDQLVCSTCPDANGECLTIDLHPDIPHQWHKLSDCPGECSKHTVVHFQGCLYIFGGDDGGRSMLNQLLAYDIATNTWCHPVCRGNPPAARYHHSASVAGASMLIFGGYTGDLPSNSNLTNKNDLFEFRFPTGEWREWNFDPRRRMPVPRAAHGAAVHDHKLWIFGGYDGNCRLNDMWYVSLRSSSSAAGNSWADYTGWTGSGCPSSWAHWPASDVFEQGFGTSGPSSSQRPVWVEVQQKGSIPPTCCNFALAVARDSIYLFSGHSGARITNKLFQFQFGTTTWTRINTEHILCGGLPAPEKRYGHTMLAYNRHLYVFGGATGGTVLPNQLHCYDLDTQTWSTVEPAPGSQVPSGRLFHSGTLVETGLYILGGTMDTNRRSRELFRIGLSDLPLCTLREDFGALLEKKVFCDVVFLLEGARVMGHAAFVVARSSYLRDRIREARSAQQPDGANEKAMSAFPVLEVPLPDVEPRPFELLLSYIYTDTICPTHPEEDPHATEVVILMIKVYQLAIRFQLRRLEGLFADYFDNLMSTSNVLIALQTAWKMTLHNLVASCLRFIVKEANYEMIVMSAEFECLEQPLMVEIVRRRERPNASYPFSPQHQVADSQGELASVKLSQTAEIVVQHETGCSLEQDLSSFLEGPVGAEFSDLTLEVSGDSPTLILCHRAVLAARCSFFQAMFRSLPPPPKGHVPVRLGQSVPPSCAVRSLLRYLYCGDTVMPPDHALHLFTAPYYFGCTNARLQLACKQNLEANISVDNVIDILDAAEKVQAAEMKQHALGIIVANPHKVAYSPALKKLPANLLVEIIQAMTSVVDSARAGPQSSSGPAQVGKGSSSRRGLQPL